MRRTRKSRKRQEIFLEKLIKNVSGIFLSKVIIIVLFMFLLTISPNPCNAETLDFRLKSFLISNTVVINCKKCDYAEFGIRCLVSYGHGFIVKCEMDTCYVLTVNHILPFEDVAVYSFDMKPFQVLQRIIDPKHNLAIIKIKVRDASVFDYTNKLTLPKEDMSVLTGVITTSGFAVERGKILNVRKEKGIEVFEHDLYLNHGYDGSIVINEDGQIVGINLYRLSNGNGLAISTEEIKRFFDLVFGKYRTQENESLK